MGFTGQRELYIAKAFISTYIHLQTCFRQYIHVAPMQTVIMENLDNMGLEMACAIYDSFD